MLGSISIQAPMNENGIDEIRNGRAIFHRKYPALKKIKKAIPETKRFIIKAELRINPGSILKSAIKAK